MHYLIFCEIIRKNQQLRIEDEHNFVFVFMSLGSNTRPMLHKTRALRKFQCGQINVSSLKRSILKM